MIGTTNVNLNCSPCAFNADLGGLNQILWYNESITLTLDTVSVFVTTYNGSNATAITRYSTIYGDIETVNVSAVPAAMSIFNSYVADKVPQYGAEGPIYLARGTDGSIGSVTSYAWPLPYIQVSSIAYTTTVSFAGCPSGGQTVAAIASTTCYCALDGNGAGFFIGETIAGLSTTTIPLPSTLYFPVPPQYFNLGLLESGMLDEFAYLNHSDLASSIAKQPWASSLFPNLRQCATLGLPQGPPGVKIPVTALTKTVTTTTQGVNPVAAVSTETSNSYALPGPTPVPVPTPTLTPTPNPPPSPISYPRGSSDVPSATFPGKESSTVIVGDGSSVLKNSGEPAPYVDSSASSPSASPAVHNTAAPLSTNIGLPSVAVNSETYANPSPASPIAIPTTQAIVASQTISLPSSAVSQLVVAGTTVAAAGPAATIGDQVVSLQSGALIVGTSTHSFVAPDGTNPVATIGSYVVHSLPDQGALVVAGSTLNPGDSAVTIAGTAVSLGSANLVIESSTIALSSFPKNAVYDTLAQQSIPYPVEVMTLGHTITQGAPAVTISGTPVSLGSTGLAIGSTTISLAPSLTNAIYTTSAQPTTPYPSLFVTLGHTIIQGAPAITVSGTPISLGSTGLAIGSTTISLSPSTSQAVYTVAGQVVTPVANGIVIAGQTLSPGAPAITASGTVISLGPSDLVVGSSTITLPTNTPEYAAFTLGSHAYTVSRAALAIDGTTLTEGAPAITISGTPISLGSSGLIIGSSTYNVPASSSLLTLNNGEIFTVNPVDGVQVSGSTLLEGGAAVTVDGTRLSLGTAGVVVGDSTVALQTSQGIGSAIMAGFGPSSTTGAVSATGTGATTNGTGAGQPVLFQGGATKPWRADLAVVTLAMLCMISLMVPT